MSGPVFLIGAVIACGTVLMIVKTIAAAVSSQNSHDELSTLRAQYDQCLTALDETHALLSNQSTQIAELEERVDFAERMLTQSRDRDAIGPGDSTDRTVQ